jgi:signal transduction histidine kinase/ActR/RegA family two-component response regulator
LAVKEDITERKEIEKDLIRSEKELKRAQKITHIGSWYLAVETNEVVWTEELYKMYGFDPTLPPPPYTEHMKLFTPESWELLSNSLARTRETGIPYELELKTIRKDGSNGWMWVRGETEFDEKGKTVGLWGATQDITQRKIIADELIKAKEKAEESDRLKSAFLTNMSHEIRTPMNGILGFTELLKEPNLSSDDLQDYIQTIQISGKRMLNTINSIVDISKIESGLMRVDINETNINEKIEFAYKFFKPEAEIKGLHLLFNNSLPAKEAFIKTDNEKVYGILANLVRNAIKFTYEGSIEFGYEKKEAFLEFYVKDTGVGIPKNQTELIFERFRQGSESHNRGYEGSGLGLSIAKSYVEILGGEIWVESEEGKGSIFYFTIPYIPVSEEKTEQINVISAEHKEVQIKNLKTLIVEDDEASYSLLTRMLHKISKEILHAITGVQAVEACRNNPDIDLVLMDIRMPDMDGNDATRQIRQFNTDVIIIAQTAYAFSGDKEKAIEAGCNDYISKPINYTLLFELIKKHVNN